MREKGVTVLEIIPIPEWAWENQFTYVSIVVVVVIALDEALEKLREKFIVF